MPAAVSSMDDAELAAASAANDQCPVCKSSRYLNPNMRFLINPECYHKMCTSCVDRIFSHGPAPCPVAGCRKTLRKHLFRRPTFDDVKMERDVDIRRRVAEVFNRREDEFETLRDYNDYLEEVEMITFDLTYGSDRIAAERKLDGYKDAHKASIKENARLASEQSNALHALHAAEKEDAKLRREAARREEDEMRMEKVEGRRLIIDKLATGAGDAEQIAREGERVILKRTSARQRAILQEVDFRQTNGSSGLAGEFSIRGLKRKQAAEPEKPYEPFGGLEFKNEYHVLQDDYQWDWLDKAKTAVEYTAAGYDVAAYCQRALLDAFTGLGVNIADEVASRDVLGEKTSNIHLPTKTAPISPEVPRRNAALSRKSSKDSDDVF